MTQHGVSSTYSYGQTWKTASRSSLPASPQCVSPCCTLPFYRRKAKPNQGPLFGHFFRSAPKAESSPKNGSDPRSQHAARLQFNRLFDDPDPEADLHNAPKGSEDPWTSPDLAASTELLTMNKGPTRPTQSVNATTRMKHEYNQTTSTRLADND